jgi:hypothetical protein
MENKINSIENKILEFFVFTENGIKILNSQFENYFENQNEHKNFKRIIKNLSVHIVQIENKNNKQKYQKNFHFNLLKIHQFKILILIRFNIIFLGIFPEKCSSAFAKIFLIHMYIAFINFKADAKEKINAISEQNLFESNRFESIEELIKENNNNFKDFKLADLYEVKIYEKFFLKFIGIHFINLFSKIFQKRETHYSYFKFKNLYIVDISTGEILLDWLHILGSNKNIKYYKNEKLWLELMHHSKYMMESYINEHGKIFSNSDSSFRFVKFECTSTFPRMTFIIKFIPLIKGISIIHVYSQKKLSRMNENTEQQQIKYREVDLLYGSEIRTNLNLEFRYTQPKVLQHIEKFLIEFLISNRNNEVFRVNNMNRGLKYFNYNIIIAINSVSNENEEGITIEMLINDINKKLKEMYNEQVNNNQYGRTISLNSRLYTDFEKFENELMIKKEDILNGLFGNNNNMKNNNNLSEKKNNNNNKDRKLGKYDLKNFNYNNNNEIENISASLTLNYEKDELTSFENVTIKQSREVSEIQPKRIENNNKLIKNEKEIDFDNLINQMNLTKSVFDFQETVRHAKKKSDSNVNNTKLTINVPNPNNNNNNNENIDEYVNNNIINNKNKFINNNRRNKKKKSEKRREGKK